MSIEILKTMKAEYERAIKKQGKELIQAEFQKFFQKTPSVHGVTWKQYTPHFNDGDACTFGVHEFNFTPSKEYSKYPEEKDFGIHNKNRRYHWAEGLWSDFQKDHPKWKDCKDFLNILSDCEDIFLAVFGDHAEVVVTRDGIYVTECDHD